MFWNAEHTVGFSLSVALDDSGYSSNEDDDSADEESDGDSIARYVHALVDTTAAVGQAAAAVPPRLLPPARYVTVTVEAVTARVEDYLDDASGWMPRGVSTRVPLTSEDCLVVDADLDDVFNDVRRMQSLRYCRRAGCTNLYAPGHPDVCYACELCASAADLAVAAVSCCICTEVRCALAMMRTPCCGNEVCSGCMKRARTCPFCRHRAQ